MLKLDSESQVSVFSSHQTHVYLLSSHLYFSSLSLCLMPMLHPPKFPNMPYFNGYFQGVTAVVPHLLLLLIHHLLLLLLFLFSQGSSPTASRTPLSWSSSPGRANCRAWSASSSGCAARRSSPTWWASPYRPLYNKIGGTIGAWRWSTRRSCASAPRWPSRMRRSGCLAFHTSFSVPPPPPCR